LVLDRRWVPEFLQSPLSLTVVVAAFAGSNALQPESGLLTVTLMGMAMANQSSVNIRHIIEFKENLRVLLISSLFIILAARLEMADLRAVGLPEIAFVGALILVVRPLAVGISTRGSDFSWRERILLGWVAPRGIVAAAVSSLFALELTRHGYAGAEQLASVTFLVIIATVLVYGFTAGPLARRAPVGTRDRSRAAGARVPGAPRRHQPPEHLASRPGRPPHLLRKHPDRGSARPDRARGDRQSSGAHIE
jgi:NhaP-type Na+/H+ or K+/H+ antiporter